MGIKRTVKEAVLEFSLKQAKYFLSLSEKKVKQKFWKAVIKSIETDEIFLIVTVRLDYDKDEITKRKNPSRGREFNGIIDFEITFSRTVKEKQVEIEKIDMRNQIFNGVWDYFSLEVANLADAILGFETEESGINELSAEVRGTRSTELENLIEKGQRFLSPKQKSVIKKSKKKFTQTRL